MKLRIQDNSVRFRITLRELEQLRVQKRLESLTTTPEASLTYGVIVDPEATEPMLRMEPHKMTLVLTDTYFTELLDETREGVYVKKEWSDAHGETRRFMVFIEKDRPSSRCEKPEAWIYDEIPGHHRDIKPFSAPVKLPQSVPPADTGKS